MPHLVPAGPAPFARPARYWSAAVCRVLRAGTKILNIERKTGDNSRVSWGVIFVWRRKGEGRPGIVGSTYITMLKGREDENTELTSKKTKGMENGPVVGHFYISSFLRLDR